MNGKIRVLIAEDDEGLRQVMTEVILSEPMFHLSAAVADAEAAVDAARSELPHVAIVDVRMPRGGGIAATKGIREVSSNTRVIAFSGHDDALIEAEMIEAGASDYLVKGGAIDEIVVRIRAAASIMSD